MYSTNKNLPRIRRDVAAFALRYGIRTASRHFGFAPSAVHKWIKIFGKRGHGAIPTRSSRPKNQPRKIDEEIVKKIVAKRLETGRSAEVIHAYLKREKIEVSLSTVKRTLDRRMLLKKRSKHKRYHPPVRRPKVASPGDLVQIDTIHTMKTEKKRIYTFSLIDVYSRWTYAKSFEKINGATSVKFLEEAQQKFNFRFKMIQTDHGPEFSTFFVKQIKKNHRYTRIGKPNDNAHIERVNRTIQEECLDRLRVDPEIFNQALEKYLKYYNQERLHFGINFKTPQEVLDCSQAIG